VAEITDSAYGSYLPLLGRKPQPMTADHRRMIGENDVWLLFNENYPVGVLVLVDEPDSLLIYSVAIRPELQGRGLGRRLLGWAEQQARRVGRPRIRPTPRWSGGSHRAILSAQWTCCAAQPAAARQRQLTEAACC